MFVKIPIEKRFCQRVSIADDNGCWGFNGCKDQDGYSLLTWRRNNKLEQRCHRISWILFRGEIPDGMQVLHSCDNPPCVNPAHLFIGTGLDNMLDKTRKGRNNPPIGERAGKAILTASKVIEIRQRSASGETGRSLAKAFGVGYKAISKIILRQRWKHVT